MSIISEYITFYKTEFGERKLRKLISEVSRAKRFKSFIQECNTRGILPNPKDFYACIMNSIFYSFSGKQKLIAVSLLLLNRWNEEVNSKQRIFDEHDLNQFAKRLIQVGNQLGV